MALPELEHGSVAFDADLESGDRPTSVTLSSIQHNFEPRKPSDDGIPPCPFLDLRCWCSVASDHAPSPTHTKWASFVSSGCSRLAAATQTTAGHSTTIPGTGTPPAPSITPLFTSPADTHSATTSARTPPSPSGSPALPANPVPSSSAGVTAHYTYPATGVVTAYSTLTVAAFPPPPSPFPGGPSSTTPPPSPPSHQLNTGTIIAVVLSALAVILAGALALFFCCCRDRAQRSSGRSKRVSVVESSRRRLEPHAYGGHSSHGRVSSVWTGLGSVSVDPAFDSESRRELLRRGSFGAARVAIAEKPSEGVEAPPGRGRGAAYTPGASPCPSPAPIEIEALDTLVQDAPIHQHRMRHGLLPHLDVRAANARSESSEELLRLPLSGTDYDCARGGGLERSASGVGCATESSGDVCRV
ncbi:hypothetical protein V8D89_000967 [Ganoderma adspersum]